MMDWINYGVSLAGFAATWWLYLVVAANAVRNSGGI